MLKRFVFCLTLTLSVACSAAAHPYSASALNGCAPISIPGSTAGSAVVPDGFDPTRASDLELRCYGFPPRPSSQQARAHWEVMMSHAKHYVFPGIVAAPPGTTAHVTQSADFSRQGASPYSSPTSTNYNHVYAGFRVPTSQPQGTRNWWGTSAQWVQPSFTFTNTYQSTPIWTAIGSSGFPQAGTIQTGWQSGPSFFYECSQYPSVQYITKVGVRAGDSIAEGTSSGSFSGYNWDFFVEDVTTDSYTDVYDNCTGNTGAAWFSLEQPNGTTYGYDTFAPFNFSYAQANSNSDSNYLNYFSYIEDDILYGTTYIYPGSVGSYGNYTMHCCT